MPEEEIGFDHLKELLLLLCHYPYEEANKEALAELTGEVRDWDRMVELINAHGIIALAAYNVREAGLEKNLPAAAMDKLENGLMQSMVRNSWLTERWKEVNAILTNEGINHILLKGMALEHTLYGAKGLRQMNDNDILVERKEAKKAWTLLQEKGFSQGVVKSRLFNRIVEDYSKHLPCLYKDGYAIEIHHKLYENENRKGDEKHVNNDFDDAVEILVGGKKALILSKEKQIAHLIDHFKNHLEGGEGQLRLYNDIALLNYGNDINFPDDFIFNPSQIYKLRYLRASYKATVRSVPVNKRWMFVLGDMFPSQKWMKKRYNCNTIKAVLHYPVRIGKLLWLI